MPSDAGVGWADVATKGDLAGLEERLDLRFEGLEERIDLRFKAQAQSFRADLHSELRSVVWGLVTALLTMTSLCLVAIGLAR